MPKTESPVGRTVEDRVFATLDEAAQLLAEIDHPLVDHSAVVDNLDQRKSLRAALPMVVDEHGFDFRVHDIPLAERKPVQIDACPVCTSCVAEPRFSIDGLPYQVVVCCDCGLGRLDPPPSAKAIASFYPAEYYGTSGAKFKPLVEAMVRIVGARHVRSLAKGLPRGARVLDVGCGRGVLLSALADRGFEAHGFEINPTATAGADPRARIRIAESLTQAAYPDGHFDQVILWHVLEHLPNPRETLLEIRRILKPGGKLVVSVPNFSSLQANWAGAAWFHLDLPRHLYHFPLSALRRLVSSCGFDCAKEHHFSLRQNPFGWLQSDLNRDVSLSRNVLYRMLKNGQADGMPFGRATRWKQWAAYYLGMPVACVFSVVEALLRRGGSVCLVAEARSNDILSRLNR